MNTQEGRSPEQSKVLAEEFTKTIRLIGLPIPNQIEESGEASSGLPIRIFIGGRTNERSVAPELSTLIRSKAEEYLKLSDVTDSYKEDIKRLVDLQLSSGLYRTLGPGYILNESGINIESNLLGIFSSNPQILKVLERDALRWNIRQLGDARRDPNSPEIQKVENWRADYISKYDEDPGQYPGQFEGEFEYPTILRLIATERL